MKFVSYKFDQMYHNVKINDRKFGNTGIYPTRKVNVSQQKTI